MLFSIKLSCKILQIIFFVFLFISSIYAGFLRIESDDPILNNITEFAPYTGTGDYSPRPDIDSFRKPGRIFIAKVDSFRTGSSTYYRYFLFETKEDSDMLINSVRRGHGMGIYWYYHDCDGSEIFIQPLNF